jgi:hypothetical protein
MNAKDNERLDRIRNQLFRLATKIAQREKAAIATLGEAGLPTLSEDEQRAFKVLQALHDSLCREQSALNQKPLPIVIDISKVPTELLLEVLEKDRSTWTIA